jgi:hypothetical protein
MPVLPGRGLGCAGALRAAYMLSAMMHGSRYPLLDAQALQRGRALHYFSQPAHKPLSRSAMRGLEAS